MEATMFTGWIYDHLKPHAATLKVAHPLMLRAIAAAQSIPEGATVEAEIPIQFTPTSKNDVRATFNLTTNDPATPTIPITCTGTAPWKVPLWGKALIGGGVVVVIFIGLLITGVID